MIELSARALPDALVSIPWHASVEHVTAEAELRQIDAKVIYASVSFEED